MRTRDRANLKNSSSCSVYRTVYWHHNIPHKGNDGSSDGLWDESAYEFYESEGDYYEETLQSDRFYYINNAVSIEEFLQYHEYGLCYLERYVVDSFPKDRLYKGAGSQWIVIDDRRCSLSSNALLGDTVTVYGRYNDIVELTFTDGSKNNQVPMVYADKPVDNSMPPEDNDEFINHVIQYMNSSDIMYGNESEYNGDYNAKLVIGVYYYWAKSLNGFNPSFWAAFTKEEYFAGWNVGRIDGYGVLFELVCNEKLSEPYQYGIITDEGITLSEKIRVINIIFRYT